MRLLPIVKHTTHMLGGRNGFACISIHTGSQVSRFPIEYSEFGARQKIECKEINRYFDSLSYFELNSNKAYHLQGG